MLTQEYFTWELFFTLLNVINESQFPNPLWFHNTQFFKSVACFVLFLWYINCSPKHPFPYLLKFSFQQRKAARFQLWLKRNSFFYDLGDLPSISFFILFSAPQIYPTDLHVFFTWLNLNTRVLEVICLIQFNSIQCDNFIFW